MLLLNGPTEREVPVSVESSTLIGENVADVESCTWYEVAVVEAFQLRVWVTGTPVAPFNGELRTGAAGGLTAPEVVKEKAPE